MSVELHVLVRDEDMPMLDGWQKAIQGEGFDLVLDRDISLREHSGFWPATYQQEQTGFEFDLGPASGLIEAYPQLSEFMTGETLAANFRFGSDMNEWVAAVIASTVLTKMSNGVFFDPQEDSVAKGIEAIAIAKDTIKEVENP